MKRAGVVVVLLIAARSAWAQYGPPSTVEPSPVPMQPTMMPGIEEKSPTTAIGLSLGLTVGGLGAMMLASKPDNGETFNGALSTAGAVAFLVGPTAGHVYAGKAWNNGLAARLGGGSLMFLGFVIAISSCGL